MLKACPSAGWCFWGQWWRWRPFKKRGPWGKVGLWFLLSLPTCLPSFPSLSPPSLLSLVSWPPQVKRQSHALITRNCATADPKQQGQRLQFLTFWVRINPSPYKADLSRVFVIVAENSHAIGGKSATQEEGNTQETKIGDVETISGFTHCKAEGKEIEKLAFHLLV